MRSNQSEKRRGSQTGAEDSGRGSSAPRAGLLERAKEACRSTGLDGQHSLKDEYLFRGSARRTKRRDRVGIFFKHLQPSWVAEETMGQFTSGELALFLGE